MVEEWKSSTGGNGEGSALINGPFMMQRLFADNLASEELWLNSLGQVSVTLSIQFLIECLTYPVLEMNLNWHFVTALMAMEIIRFMGVGQVQKVQKVLRHCVNQVSDHFSAGLTIISIIKKKSLDALCRSTCRNISKRNSV